MKERTYTINNQSTELLNEFAQHIGEQIEKEIQGIVRFKPVSGDINPKDKEGSLQIALNYIANDLEELVRAIRDGGDFRTNEHYFASFPKKNEFVDDDGVKCEFEEWGFSIHVPVELKHQSHEEIVDSVTGEAIAIIEERYNADLLCEGWKEKVFAEVSTDLDNPELIDEKEAIATIANGSFLIG